MKKLEIQSTIGTSEIFVGETLANVSKYLPQNRKIAIITDPVIHKLYGNQFPKVDLILEIPQGEQNKCLQTLDNIFEQLIAAEFDRTSFILGIGGGIICDMSGFIATIFMRGIDFGFVSTTLLSQVDASVGGKNGVNFRGIKNIIGTFSLPKFVICELDILRSLPKTEILSGMGEVVKYGCIYSEDFFKYIENHIDDIKNYSLDVFETLVYESVRIKAEVVSKDAKESGARRMFNFGHTFGHAIEKLTHMPHGCAVSVGMVYAAKLSVLKGKMSQSDCNRLISLLEKMEMPTTCEAKPEELLQLMRSDKKREGDSVHFVYLTSIGTCVVEKLSYTELAKVINDLR